MKIIGAERRSPILTPSTLACLSRIPTVNLTAGCLHDCAYCYIRGYNTYPGEGRIIVYNNTLEKLRGELARRPTKPRAVYFSPSSDLFQPAAEVLQLTEAVLELLLSEGIGVAFLTKGHIPDRVLKLLIGHAELVQAQIGMISLDERIVRAFEVNAAEPQDRLRQMEALIAGGVHTEARLDPILPGLSDSDDSADDLFGALAEVGVKRTAAGVLFLRPAIVQSLKRSLPTEMLAPLLAAYERADLVSIRAKGSSVHTLPREARRGIFAHIGQAALAHGLKLSVCACKNPDLARGFCNIAGTWPKRSPRREQLPLPK